MILINIYYKNPDSYRLLFTAGSFSSTTSPFSNDPDVQRVSAFNECAWKDRNLLVLVEYILECSRRALELYHTWYRPITYHRIDYISLRYHIIEDMMICPYDIEHNI